MGLFQDLFGSSNKQSSQSTTNQNTTQTQSQKQQQTGTTTGTTAQQGQAQQTGKSVVSSLDAGTLDQLKSLIPSLLQKVQGGGASADAANIRDLTGRLVTNSNTNIDEQIKALQTNARNDFAQNEGANIKQVQQQVGSRGNSYSALIESVGNSNLEAKLAAIAADAKSNARTQSDSEIASAISGLTSASSVDAASSAQPLQNFLALIQTLSSAQTTTETTGATTNTQTGQSSQMSDLLQTLQGLATDTTTGSSTASGKGSSSQGAIKDVLSIFK